MMWFFWGQEAHRPRAGSQAPVLERGLFAARPAIAGTRRHGGACRVGFPRRVLGRVPGRRRPLLLGLPPSPGGVPCVGGPARARGGPAVESTGGGPPGKPQRGPPRSGGRRGRQPRSPPAR